MAITQYYYSPTTKGIYSAEVHGTDIPTDRVAITLAQYAQVAAGTHSVTVSGTTATTVQIIPQAAGADSKVIVDSVGIGNKYGSITIADQETPSAVTARFLFGNTTSGYGALRLITNSTKNVTIDAVDWATSATQKDMCLQPNGGNIGIGTATPSAKLYVVGESYVDYANQAGITGGSLRFASNSNASSVSNNEYYGIDGLNRFTRTGGSGKIRIWQTNDAMGGAIDFLSGKTGQANTPITHTSTMMLTSDGRVGIGIQTPAARLQTIDTNNAARFGNNAVNSLTIGGHGGSPYCGIGYNVNFDSGVDNQYFALGADRTSLIRFHDGGFEFKGNATNGAVSGTPFALTEYMTILRSGNVGIGTIAPTAKLEISGRTIISSAVSEVLRVESLASGIVATSVQTWYRNGTICGFVQMTGGAIGIVTTSDHRLKNNVRPLVSALDKISKLNPVSFNWIKGDAPDTGFIAHEVQSVIPNAACGEKDAVNEDGSILVQGVSSEKLIAWLVAGMKELKAIVEAQAARIAALEGN